MQTQVESRRADASLRSSSSWSLDTDTFWRRCLNDKRRRQRRVAVWAAAALVKIGAVAMTAADWRPCEPRSDNRRRNDPNDDDDKGGDGGR